MLGLNMIAMAKQKNVEFQIRIIGVHTKSDGLYVSAVDDLGRLIELRSEEVKDIHETFRPSTFRG